MRITSLLPAGLEVSGFLLVLLRAPELGLSNTTAGAVSAMASYHAWRPSPKSVLELTIRKPWMKLQLLNQYEFKIPTGGRLVSWQAGRGDCVCAV